MKKKLISILSIIIMLSMVSMASAYSSGSWAEAFVGGGEGRIGNKIFAFSITEWRLENLTLSGFDMPDPMNPPQMPDGTYQYKTLYNQGVLYWISLLPSPFTSPLVDVNATVYAYKNADGSYAHGDIILQGGGHTMTGDLTETYKCVGNDGLCVEFPVNSNNYYDGHFGNIINVRIDEPLPQVPEPMSIILLGLGMIGLAGLRRKFKK